MVVIAMALLTFLGAEAGPPTEIEMEVAPQYEDGKVAVAGQGCLTCHKIGENGGTLGPDLTHIGSELPARAIERTLLNPSGIMPPYTELLRGEARRDHRVPGVAALAAARRRELSPLVPRTSSPRRCGGCSTASRASTTSSTRS